MKEEVDPKKAEKLVLETAKALTGYIKEHQQDDICHGKGECMHGGNDPCPECDGKGQIVPERVKPENASFF